MKKTMFIALMGIFSFIAVNAENEELNSIATDQPADVTEATVTNIEAEQTAAEQTEAEQTEAEQTVAEQTEEAKSIDNELMLQYPTLYTGKSEASTSVKAANNYYNEGYRQTKEWKNAHTLRNAGMITALAAFAAEIPLALCFANKATYKGGNSTAETAATVITGTVGFIEGAATAGYICIGPEIAGIIMWAVGNHNMRKARLSYTGNGLSYNF